jgi:hypothetical protein
MSTRSYARSLSTRSEYRLFSADDLVPNPVAVCFPEQETADDNSHGRDNHRVIEAGKYVAGRRAAP